MITGLRYHQRVRLLVLSARPGLRTNSRLAESAVELGLDCEIIDAGDVSALYDGARLVPVGAEVDCRRDTMIARIGNWRPESMLAVLEAVVACGVATPNPPAAIRAGRDHWITGRALVAAGLPFPPMLAGIDPEVLAAHAITRLELPVVVKQRRSRMGIGVIRCSTRDHLESVLDSLWRLGDEIVVQRWIAGGERSHRLLVVGERVVAAATFAAGNGEWRSNSARGGTAVAYEPSPEEADLAKAAAATLGLGHCGVDLVTSENRPMILEVNPTPGFLRLEEASGVDVARMIVEHAVGADRL